MEVITEEYGTENKTEPDRKTGNGFGTAGFVLSLFPFIYAWIKQIILWSTGSLHHWDHGGYNSFREMGNTVWRVLDISWNVIWLHAIVFSLVGLIFGIVARRTLTLSIVGLCFALTYLFMQTGNGMFEFFEFFEDILDF